MQIIALYRYARPDGGVTVSTEQPDGAFTQMYRLVADEGMELVKGDVQTTCVDTDDIDGWQETAGQEISGEEFLDMLEEVL